MLKTTLASAALAAMLAGSAACGGGSTDTTPPPEEENLYSTPAEVAEDIAVYPYRDQSQGPWGEGVFFDGQGPVDIEIGVYTDDTPESVFEEIEMLTEAWGSTSGSSPRAAPTAGASGSATLAVLPGGPAN